jgi:hypothetical protein
MSFMDPFILPWLVDAIVPQASLLAGGPTDSQGHMDHRVLT